MPELSEEIWKNKFLLVFNPAPSLIHATINAIVIRVMHKTFDHYWSRSFRENVKNNDLGNFTSFFAFIGPLEGVHAYMKIQTMICNRRVSAFTQVRR